LVLEFFLTQNVSIKKYANATVSTALIAISSRRLVSLRMDWLCGASTVGVTAWLSAAECGDCEGDAGASA
jgi:hypothetical protein